VSDYREFKDGEIIAGTRYRVIRLIGVGGMGSVYEVEHVELGKRFVLKALLRQLSRRHDLVLRLRNEWRALGRLEHPHIVTVTDAGTSAGGVPFYVMERLDGDTLAVRMRKVRRFAIPEALAIVARVLEGLAAAHQIGIVHRDIKPPNIFMIGADHPKILDFGVAKIADDPGVVTARGVAIGTPRYMSPEQARGDAVDSRSDIYSTGLILFEMITGVNPFEDARDSKELLVAHLTRSAPRLSSLTRGVPEQLDRILGQMLAKDTESRPRDARDVAAALSALRERWSEISRTDEGKESVAVMPLLSAAPVDDDTTRPDGVASRTRPLETSSAGRIAWTRDSDAQASAGPLEPSRFEPTAATVRSLTGASGSLVVDVPSAASSAGQSSASRSFSGPRTEMLDATPVPPTRTRAPITPSETPSSRKLSGAFHANEEVIPDFRGLSRWIPWFGFGAVALAVIGLLLFDLGRNEVAAPIPVPASPKASPHWVAERSALRPAMDATTPAPASAPPQAAPSVEELSSPKPATSSEQLSGRKRERGARRAKSVRPALPAAAPPPSAAPSKPRAPAESSRRTAAPEGALPASGL
jgi:serine/threonine-protein kinase